MRQTPKISPPTGPTSRDYVSINAPLQPVLVVRVKVSGKRLTFNQFLPFLTAVKKKFLKDRFEDLKQSSVVTCSSRSSYWGKLEVGNKTRAPFKQETLERSQPQRRHSKFRCHGNAGVAV